MITRDLREELGVFEEIYPTVKEAKELLENKLRSLQKILGKNNNIIDVVIDGEKYSINYLRLLDNLFPKDVEKIEKRFKSISFIDDIMKEIDFSESLEKKLLYLSLFLKSDRLYNEINAIRIRCHQKIFNLIK